MVKVVEKIPESEPLVTIDWAMVDKQENLFVAVWKHCQWQGSKLLLVCDDDRPGWGPGGWIWRFVKTWGCAINGHHSTRKKAIQSIINDADVYMMTSFKEVIDWANL